MHIKRTSQDSIRRVLTTGFTVQDIAEPLISFNCTDSPPAVHEELIHLDFDCAGVREKGLVVGFIYQQELLDSNGADCRGHTHSFDDGMVVSGDTGLAEIVQGLVEHPRLFITVLGSVCGIVTRLDLGKPPMRMWLFGMLSIIEMRLVRLITERFPGDTWQEKLSDGRIAKAKQLLVERTRRGQQVDLIDCLQLGDKGDVIAKDQQLKETMHLGSRRQVEDTMKKMQSLRNNLAHSQEIVQDDWEMIVMLAENLNRVIEGPPGKAKRMDE